MTHHVQSFNSRAAHHPDKFFQIPMSIVVAGDGGGTKEHEGVGGGGPVEYKGLDVGREVTEGQKLAESGICEKSWKIQKITGNNLKKREIWKITENIKKAGKFRNRNSLIYLFRESSRLW
jgi:hypothetical protein